MKFQAHYLGKNKKVLVSLSFAEVTKRVVRVNELVFNLTVEQDIFNLNAKFV